MQGLVAEQRETEVESVEGNLVTLILSRLYDCLKSFPSVGAEPLSVSSFVSLG